MDINNKRTRTTISIVMLIWAVVCIAVTGLYVGNNHAEAATTGTLTSDYVYFRKSPNGTPIKYNGSAILLRKGQKMTVLSRLRPRVCRGSGTGSGGDEPS